MSDITRAIQDANGWQGKKKVEFLIQFVICNVFGGNCKMLAFSAESSQMYSLNKA